MNWKIGESVGLDARGDYVPAKDPLEVVGTIEEVTSTCARVTIIEEHQKRCGGDEVEIPPVKPTLTMINFPQKINTVPPKPPRTARVNIGKLLAGDVLDDPLATVLSVVAVYDKEIKMLEGYRVVMRIHADDAYKHCTIPSGTTVKIRKES